MKEEDEEDYVYVDVDGALLLLSHVTVALKLHGLEIGLHSTPKESLGFLFDCFLFEVK